MRNGNYSFEMEVAILDEMQKNCSRIMKEFKSRSETFDHL
jgi:hypothetical protein